MHRVELKGRGRCSGVCSIRLEVPNAPCGVESLSTNTSMMPFSMSGS